jgi:uncharacterized membrane protein YdbT with pleckstrin-like domain
VLVFGSATHSIGQIQILGSPPLYKLIAGFSFLIGVMYGTSELIKRSFTQYIITNKRILIKKGIIREITIEILAHKIECIQSEKTLLGRMLNYGSIIIVGVGGSQDPFPYIPSPEKFRNKVQILGMQEGITKSATLVE